MSSFEPKSYLHDVGEGVICYDLEFVSGEAAHVGYEFAHTSGLLLTIDANQNGDPLAMTLIHKAGKAAYEATDDYESFVAEAQKAYAFAKHMIAFAEAQKDLIRRKRAANLAELDRIHKQLEEDLFASVQRAERFGEQRRAA